MEDPVVFEEDGGPSSRLRLLQRPKFRVLLDHARPDDTVHVSEMFRLVRGTGRILDVLDALHRDRLALRIHDGAFSTMDLTARHPRTGELLSTVKFTVRTLAAAGELQREPTYDGLRAAEANGSKGGRGPAVPAGNRRRTHRVPGRPLHRRPRPRPRRRPRRDPHGNRRPPARPHRHRGGRPRPGASGHPDMPRKAADFLRSADLAP
ncbi:recombinase family protein [Streptomyces sp. NPDC001851]|uniref:recombinase family protein n=1 Tax=Streptomyces sp. NPDC001851 TaxID=3154529 RepID=UPI0033198588